MNFKQWIKENDYAIAEIAELLNVSKFKLYKICAEKPIVPPALEKEVRIYFLIYRMTGGLLAPHDLLPEVFNYEMLKEIYGCPHCRAEKSKDELLRMLCKHARSTAKLRSTREGIEKEISEWMQQEKEIAAQDTRELNKLAQIAEQIARNAQEGTETEIENA